MIKIIKGEGQLLLRYTSDRNLDARWVDEKLQKEGVVAIKRPIFLFKPSHLTGQSNTDLFSEDVRTFILGVADGDFYRIDRGILGLKDDLYLHKDILINDKTFVAYRDISIFRKIDRLVEQSIVVGGNSDDSIPEIEFAKLLGNFPTSTELTHYADARIERTLKDYLGTIADAQKKLNDFLNRKKSVKVKSRIVALKEYELEKYKFIRDSFIEMLDDVDSPSEHDWQELIVELLLLIFPKYLAVLENVEIEDFYSRNDQTTGRKPDLVLVDANGNIDVIEIKKPFPNCILSSKYRDNYAPNRELSGAVMQVEKYLFHLNKWGSLGEEKLNQKWAGQLPNNLKIKVTNPKAILILGRDDGFTADQKFDFEIIKRKYANIIDIMTYDDLLRRLENIISMIERNYAKLGATSKRLADEATP